LKWITLELGPARDLDVFIEGVVTPATAGKSQQPGVATLTRDLRRRQREAFGRARSAIESHRVRTLVLDIAAWIEAGDWTRNADEPARAFREQPIATAAAAEMDRRRKKIVKRGTNWLNSIRFGGTGYEFRRRSSVMPPSSLAPPFPARKPPADE
jgi:triphosphatase